MKKILVVEDDEQLQEASSIKLKKAGFDVMSAFTAVEARELLRNFTPDLILLDVMLPGGMNGFDFLEQIRKVDAFKDVPVILLTNLDAEQESAKNLGVKDYLIKSNISIDDLVERVNKYTN